MVLPKTHPAFPRSYCFRKSAIDLAKDQSQYFAHWLMSQTPMVLPRTHLGSSQISMSEVISPGLETQTKSILCTLAYEPNHYGSSKNSSWVIPDLNAWGNQSKNGIWTKLKLSHCPLSQALWFFQKASRSSQNLFFQKTYHRLGKGLKQILCSLANEPNPYGSSQNSSWVIPELKVWGNLSWTWNTNKVNTLYPGFSAKPHWFFLELILGHPRSQCLRKFVQDWNMNKAKTLHTVLWAKPYGSSKKHPGLPRTYFFRN